MRHDQLPARDAVLIVCLLALSSLVVAVARAAEHEECTKKMCSGPTRCQRVNGIDTCICPRSMAKVFSPICGSNGKSYVNAWELAAKTCHLKDEVKGVHPGECNKTSNPCSTVDCGIHQKCEVVKGKASCVTADCPKKCPGLRLRPPMGGDNRLCGYDGKTYENLCMLRKENCPPEKYVMVKHKGECQREHKPNNRSTTKPKSVEDDCFGDCNYSAAPVCGTNGKIYSNACDLMRKTCHLYERVEKAPFSRCKETNDPCSTRDCGIHRKCTVFEGKATCEPDCPKSCPPDDKPGKRKVCGTDGKTYKNLCELKRKSCSTKTEIKVRNKGECRKDDKSSDGSDEKPPRKTSSTHHPRRPKHHSSERSDID